MLGATLPAADGEDLLRAGAAWLLANYSMDLVAITMGADGSLLVRREEEHRRKGIQGRVADTVGAGDAFTAALVDSYLRGASLARMNEAGNRWGGWVASQAGAMPALDEATLEGILGAIAAV
jgi:fructokinase